MSQSKRRKSGEGKAKRRTSQELAELAQHAKDMLLQGFSPQEVAQATTLSLQKVFQIKVKALESGEFQQGSPNVVIVRAGTRFGSIIEERLEVEPDALLRLECTNDCVTITLHPSSAQEVQNVQK